MPRQLRYTDDALADLEDARRWLTQPGSGPAAHRKLTAIWVAIERLKERPCLWAANELHGVREMPCQGGYRVFYEVTPDTGRNENAGNVLVLRIYGPRQSRDVL